MWSAPTSNDALLIPWLVDRVYIEANTLGDDRSTAETRHSEPPHHSIAYRTEFGEAMLATPRLL